MEKYTFSWNEYERNFPKRFSQFYEKKEFVDVTLVTEGNLIGVHRVILSAISPYFHEMFSESHKPHVVLDNITERSLVYLIDYIYSGKVEVEHTDLEDFLRAAKSLRVQGIDDIDKTTDLNNPLSMPSNSLSNQRINNGEIRDIVKSETTKCDDQQNDLNSNDSHDDEEENSTDPSDTESFDDSFEGVNWTPDSEESFDRDEAEEEEEKEKEESYCTCECPCPDETNINNTDQNQSVCTNVTCPVGRFNDVNEELDCPPSKRAKIDSSGFDIDAKIRVSANNTENLFYNGYKYSKNKILKSGSICWRCTLRPNRKCKAYVQTKIINDVMMMKVVRAEHTHPPNGEKDFSDFNIVAYIRRNNRGLDNLYHDGYKFCKNSVSELSTSWVCTMCSSAKCRARAYTRNVNGVTMAKLTAQEHNHQRKTN